MSRCGGVRDKLKGKDGEIDSRSKDSLM